jgi:CBS domain-containing protein
MGILTMRHIIQGLEAEFPQESSVVEVEAGLTVLLNHLLSPETRELSNRPVREVMGPVKITINADDALAKALAIMLTEHVGMMPVMHEENLVGMVRLSDIFQVITQAFLKG